MHARTSISPHFASVITIAVTINTITRNISLPYHPPPFVHRPPQLYTIPFLVTVTINTITRDTSLPYHSPPLVHRPPQLYTNPFLVTVTITVFTIAPSPRCQIATLPHHEIRALFSSSRLYQLLTTVTITILTMITQNATLPRQHPLLLSPAPPLTIDTVTVPARSQTLCLHFGRSGAPQLLARMAACSCKVACAARLHVHKFTLLPGEDGSRRMSRGQHCVLVGGQRGRGGDVQERHLPLSVCACVSLVRAGATPDQLHVAATRVRP